MRDNSQELQEYYESSFEMFFSIGWRYFIEDMDALRESIDNLSAVKGTEELWFKKGQLDILELILERKKAFETAYEDIKRG